MDQQEWQRITQLFDAALNQPPSEREAYLVRTCGEDVAVFNEVARLLSAFEKGSDFLEAPPIELRHALSVGDLIAERYRVEALLGIGGMGEVYRVHDELLGESFAMKTLRPELTESRTVVKCFQREIRLARKVTHPNICRVFEVGVHNRGNTGLDFFVMELLEGETLAERIRRNGAISNAEAFPLIVQLAEGLSAAHQLGIVHRDFKSSNVILCGERAVITDFGLAQTEPGTRILGASSTMSSDHLIAGTVAYMSPEQLSGGKIYAATDIYSLGVVLFEMASGRLPFDDQHIINSAMQKAAEPAPNIRALVPGIDPEWASVIRRCLQRDPAKRVASAGEIARKFAPGHRRFASTHLAHLRGTRRSWITAVISGAAGLSALELISRFYSREGRLPEGANAVLTPITNATGEDRFQSVADALTELFRVQLSQSVHLNIVGAESLADALNQMGKTDRSQDPVAVREAAWRLNAALEVYGNVSRIGSDYALNIQIETRGSRPDRPAMKSLRSFAGSDAAALMGAVREASVWVRQSAGESASNIASFDKLPAEVTTPSWEALSYYARGQRFFIQQQYESALLEFEAALRVDPGFTLAALRRADLLVSRGRQFEGFQQYRTAIDMLKQRSVTRAEELNARGIFGFDSGDIEASDKYFRTWAVEYPEDWRPPYYRVIGLILNGHASEALDILAHLRQRMPDFGDVYAQTIAAHLVLGQTDQARSFVAQLRRFNGPNRGDSREGFVRFREGNLVGFLEILRINQQSKNQVSAIDAMLHEAMMSIDTGIPAVVSQRVEDFLAGRSWAETLPDQASLRAIQAWSEMLTGEYQRAVTHARRALELESGPLIVALAGTVFARAGATAFARMTLELSSKLPDVNLYRIAHHRISGELARMSGKEDLALGEFRSAAALEPVIAHRQYLIEALPPGPERMALCLNVVRIPWQALRPPPMHSVGSLSLAIPAVNEASPGDPFARKFAASSVEFHKAVQNQHL